MISFIKARNLQTGQVVKGRDAIGTEARTLWESGALVLALTRTSNGHEVLLQGPLTDLTKLGSGLTHNQADELFVACSTVAGAMLYNASLKGEN